MAGWLVEAAMGATVVLAGGAAGLLTLGLAGTAPVRFLGEVHAAASGSLAQMARVGLRRLGTLNRPCLRPFYEVRVRRALVQAGEPGGYRPEDLLALQEVGAAAGLLLGLLLARLLGTGLLTALLFGALGAGLPLLWLRDQVVRRQLLISRALPFGLDLLTLSVEAGLDFSAALAKVVEKGRPGPWREELQLVLRQLKMGKTRAEALQAMVARVDLPALTTFVTALLQADRMGTRLGPVLRVQATHLRTQRTLRAEKLAGEAPVKMLLPLLACIFPTVFLVLFGPLVFALMFGHG